MIHKRDRQTDTHTDRQIPHADIGRAYASHRAGGNHSLAAGYHLQWPKRLSDIFQGR